MICVIKCLHDDAYALWEWGRGEYVMGKGYTISNTTPEEYVPFTDNVVICP